MSTEIDYRHLFEALPGLYLLLTPELIIVGASDAYLRATMTRREDVMGRHLFQVFPDNPDDPDATGVSKLGASLQRVLAGRVPDAMAVQKYDVRRPEAEGGAFEERYWSPVNSPVFGPDGRISLIVHRVEDVTEFMRLKGRGQKHERDRAVLDTRVTQMETEIYARAAEIQGANARLHEANRSLHTLNQFLEALLENIPSMIFVKDAKTLRFERINRAGEALLGVPREALIGRDDYAFFPPEQAAFFQSQDRVALASHLVTDIPEEPLRARGEDRWLHTRKVPLFDEGGAPRWLLGICQDITEWKRVAEALHAQNEELHAQEEELRAQAAELAENHAELTRQNEELARASRLKSDFLANMSHELRTPLNAVIGFSELLLAGDYGPLDTQKSPVVRDVLAAGTQLLTLINDVLDLSKIEAGRVEVRSVSMDVAEPVREACSMVASVAGARSVALVNRVAEGAVLAAADPDRVRQVLLNLASNAVKFTPAGGTVTVDAVYDDTGVRVAVTDTGIGIAKADAPRLFAPFSQLDSGYNRRFQGTGLGLSVCKGLVDLMGGTIGFTSEPGKGSTFFFTLPSASSAPRDDAAPPSPPPSSTAPLARATVLLVEDGEPDARVIAGGLRKAGYVVVRARSAEEALARIDTVKPSLLIVDIGLPGMSGFELVAQIRARAAWKRTPIAVLSAHDISAEDRARLAASVEVVARKGDMTREELVARLVEISVPPRLRALVVDDSEPNRKVVRTLLERVGCEVIEVADAEGAIRAAREEALGVILMDVQMPGMDGLTATGHLKADPATSAIPIVAVTAHAMAGDAERAKAAGCVAYVSKPVARARLYEAIDLALGDAAWRTDRPSTAHQD
jgi:PAS domain S-box-containing protein